MMIFWQKRKRPAPPGSRSMVSPFLLVVVPLLAAAVAAPGANSARTEVLMKRDIPFSEPVLPLQKLDVYAPAGAMRLPVVFWIHGGGWQTGDKSEMNHK